MRTKLLSLLIALLLSMASSGFAQDLRFTIWSGNQSHLDMLTGFADSFKDAYPNSSVRLDTIPFGDYVQKVTIQLAGGNPPDIGWLAEASAPTFIEAGVLTDLAPYLTTDDTYNFADFSDPALGLWRDGEALYGIPFSTSPFFVYFNAEMFDAAGLDNPAELAARGEWTWDAFRTAAKAIADSTPAGTYGYEQSDGEGYGARLWVSIVPMLRAYGADAWNAEGECQLATPEAVRAMTQYHDMIFDDESIVPPGERANFFSGQSGMTITQLSRAANLADADFEWSVAPLPSGPAGDVALIGQAALVVFNNSPNRDEAIEFLKHMTMQDNVATMAQFFPPARVSVLDSDGFLSSNAILTAEQMAVVQTASLPVRWYLLIRTSHKSTLPPDPSSMRCGVLTLMSNKSLMTCAVQFNHC